MLSRIFQDDGNTSRVRDNRSGAKKNDNRSHESAGFVHERGDSKSVDIVARRKSLGEHERLPNSRKSTGSSDANSRAFVINRKNRKQPKKNNSSVSRHKRGTARQLRSAEGTFHVHKIYGDGNCMFRAVSYVLWGNEDEHGALRTLVTNHIKNHWREYGGFVAAEWNITSPDEYKNFMITEGVFATELECTVATKLHKMNLSIYRETNDRGDAKRVFHNRVNGDYDTARLLFSGRPESGHYDVLSFLHP